MFYWFIYLFDLSNRQKFNIYNRLNFRCANLQHFFHTTIPLVPKIFTTFAAEINIHY